MPLHIDRFMGSRYVQAMHPSAQMGYISLIAAQWQTDDCTLPNDEEELGILSGLSKWGIWQEHAKTILRHFSIMDEGRRRNSVCLELWLDAKRVFEARQSSAKNTNRRQTDIENKKPARSPSGHRTAHPTVTERSPVRSADTQTITGTGTDTGTEEKQVSEAKASSPRPVGDDKALEAIYRVYPRKVGKRVAMKAIARAVQHVKARGMPLRDAQVWLYHRVEEYARSPAGQHGEFTPHPATWMNQGRYDDDPAEWQREEKAHVGQNGKAGGTEADAEAVAHLIGWGKTGQDATRH
jgi:hypothetical protein